MKSDIDKLLVNELTPLHIRLFIYNLEMRNSLKYSNRSFQQAVLSILNVI